VPFSRVEERLAELRRGPRARHLPPDGAGSSATQRWIAQEVITEAVLAHEIAAAGFGPMTEASIRRLVERVTADVTVAEADVAAYYGRNVDLYRRRETRRVRLVLVESEAAACDIVRRLENGVQMDALARSESLDPGSRDNGGDLGEIGREQFAGPLGDALFAAPIGELVGPIRTAHGWHVALVELITLPSVVPYDEARPAIEAELLAAERSRVFAQWLDERRTAIAHIEPQFTHPGDPAIGVPVHRH
jgi:hypothetical protein